MVDKANYFLWNTVVTINGIVFLITWLKNTEFIHPLIGVQFIVRFTCFFIRRS